MQNINNKIKEKIKMKNKSNFIMYTLVGTVIGTSIGMIAAKKMCCKSNVIKKTAGKALRAAGSFVEHMTF